MMIESFFEESFFYVIFAGTLQACGAILLLPVLVLHSRRGGRGAFSRLLRAYVIFNSFLLFWGCIGHFVFHSLTFHKFYFSADHVVDWFPFIPFGQWVLNQTLGDSHSYLIGSATLGQLRWIWLAVAVPTWLLTYASTRFVLRLEGPGLPALSDASRVG